MILLAGWWSLLTPLKNDGVSWDDFPFPILWERHKIHVPNHQLGPKMSPVVSCCRSSGSLHVVLFEAKNSFNVNLSIWSNWQPPGLIWRHWTLFSILPGWCWNTSGWQSREDHLGLTGRWNSPASCPWTKTVSMRSMLTSSNSSISDILWYFVLVTIFWNFVSDCVGKNEAKNEDPTHVTLRLFMYWAFHAESDDRFHLHLYRYIYIYTYI